ncbi:SusC/RagA family TonB-linked outer membrane protein [Butyricimonas faecalis]|uniref:SusC/RagA family TonB-linked outer membrane protein n=2 Tax=Butyricimonas faecalis TaxID=2093856 RepID=A0A3Q9IP95_9BACT|nr:SusC/RagA family TonB-linked outer membrane protein [Butyricimonas faecalis]
MEKFLLCLRVYRLHGQKFWKTMKLFMILMCCFTFSLSANSFAQQEKVNLDLRDVSIKTLFSEIQRQTKLHFIFSSEQANRLDKLTVKATDETVKSVLDRIFEGTGFSYTFRDDIIMVRFEGEQAAQQVKKEMEIRGVVKDKNGDPLPGVTVLVGGTTLGTATDGKGEFLLKVPEQESVALHFSFVGMKTQELVFKKGQQPLTVVMEEDSESIEEIVVTGYQQIEKRNLTSSVVTVKTSELQTIGASSIEQMLQGVVPGLSVVNTSASPGAAPKIRIRGTATIAGNADPLWVLDGVILENSVPVTAADLNSPDVMNMFNSVIGGINPNDIESITVLKDASATAIYGTRAANGVIVVTTKKGKANSFNISYQHTSSISIRPHYDDFDLLNSKERVALAWENYEDGLSLWGGTYADGISGLEGLLNSYALGQISKDQLNTMVNKLEEVNTDWFKILFRNAYTQTHNLSVSGGTEKTNYYISLNYNGEEGVDKASEYKNYGGMVKLNTQLFQGVNMGAIVQVDRRDREMYHSSLDLFNYAVRSSRAIPLREDNGDLHYYIGSVSGRASKINVLNELANSGNESTQTDAKGIVNLTVNLYKGLKYEGLFSYASSHSTARDYATEKTAYVATIRGYGYGEGSEDNVKKSPLPYGGVYNETTYEQRSSLIRNGLTYKGSLMDDLSIDVLLGQEFRNTNYKGLTSNIYGYFHDRGNTFYEPALGESTGHLKRNKTTRNLVDRSNISYYGVISAMYDNRYVLNANIRFDGSNLFGSNPKYRYLPLWSVSGRWIISNESFLSDNTLISNLALRASYGLRGNIVEDSSPSIIAAALPPNAVTGLFEMEIQQAPNPDLKWETTASFNAGLEIALFDNRLSLDIDYYLDKSKDLIAYKGVSSVSGFSGKYVNYANVTNQGLDVALSGTILKSKDWNWTAAFNMGYVKNEVTKSKSTAQTKYLVQSVYTPGEVYEGKPVNGMFSYRFAKLDGKGMPMFYDKDGNVLGVDSDEIVNFPYDIENLKYEGTRDPMLSGGLNTRVAYKNVSLSMLFAFGLKNVVRLPSRAYVSAPNSDENANSSIKDRWRPGQDNTGKTIPALSSGDGLIMTADDNFYATDWYNLSDATVVPGDYLRFRNLMIEYRLPLRWVNKVVIGDKKLSSVTLKFQAQNLFVLADKRLKGYDPETINYTTNAYGSLPLARTFTLGLNVNF